MTELIAPISFAVLAWWISTGVLIWLVGRGQGVRLAAAIVLSVMVVGGTFGVIELRGVDTVLGAYAGFLVGIGLWAWHEAMFLFGFIAGPRKTDCPAGLSALSRFRASAETLIHHEVLIACHAVLICALSFGAANQVAAATFILLWGMRLSAKLLIFLGAPNASHHFLPMHLKYISTYFNTRQRTKSFPIFICLTSAAAAALLVSGFSAPAGTSLAAAYLLLGTLALLAVFEHIALILPIPDQQLWAWAVRKKATVETKQDNKTFEYGRT